MEQKIPSRTALRVAMRRAMHQIADTPPLVLDDSYALQLLPREAAAEVEAKENAHHPVSSSMRAFMVARSRFAEDEFAAAVERGVRQYVLLGAGLDTFAWRHPFREQGVEIFEVDHPATQTWKRGLVEQAGMPEPAATRYVAVDFERQSLAGRLIECGFDLSRPAFFTWLGVVPYLTREAFRSTLAFLAENSVGSGLVFDYSLPREALAENERVFLDFLAARVAQAGEPFRLFFLPEEVRSELQSSGWRVTKDLDGVAIHDAYFRGRSDGLALRGRAGHLVSARK